MRALPPVVPVWVCLQHSLLQAATSSAPGHAGRACRQSCTHASRPHPSQSRKTPLCACCLALQAVQQQLETPGVLNTSASGHQPSAAHWRMVRHYPKSMGTHRQQRGAIAGRVLCPLLRKTAAQTSADTECTPAKMQHPKLGSCHSSSVRQQEVGSCCVF